MSDCDASPKGLPYFVDDTPGLKCLLCRRRVEAREVYHDSATGTWGHKTCVLENRADFTRLRTDEVQERLTRKERGEPT